LKVHGVIKFMIIYHLLRHHPILSVCFLCPALHVTSMYLCACCNGGGVDADSWVGRHRNLLNVGRFWVTNMDVFLAMHWIGSESHSDREKMNHSTILFGHGQSAYRPSSVQHYLHPTWEISIRLPRVSPDFSPAVTLTLRWLMSYIYIYIYIYIYDISGLTVNDLTLILLTWRKWWANNASK
jgi:hypothetical protein